MLRLLKNIFKVSDEYKLFYFGGRNSKNAGDVYNIDLMNYFGIRYSRSKKINNADIMCVGSNLDRLCIPSKRKLLIVGAGFITPFDGNDSLNREVEILALRGVLSKERMEKLIHMPLDMCVLGDPGLLISKIYPHCNVNKKYKLGIIPHYNDKSELNIEKIKLNSKDYKVIDIQQDAKKVAEDICECECILSSSLHGLIFADSYNIPNRQLIISGKLKGGNYKFEDYYSAFKENVPNVIDLKKVIIDSELIENVINSYIAKDIVGKQNELIEVFYNLRI